MSMLHVHIPSAQVSTLSVIAITLHYVFALSYNALTPRRNVIAVVMPLRSRTINSDNVSHEPRALTIRSDNDFNMLRTKLSKAITFLHNFEVLCDTANM
jgi:hypothetical protein